jgi:hypothetical protein
MQDPKYAGKYGVEQQLKLLSKWLAETGFSEAAMLVSAAAISVYEATHKKPVTRLRNRAAVAASEAAEEPAAPDGETMVEVKRRA